MVKGITAKRARESFWPIGRVGSVRKHCQLSWLLQGLRRVEILLQSCCLLAEWLKRVFRNGILQFLASTLKISGQNFDWFNTSSMSRGMSCQAWLETNPNTSLLPKIGCCNETSVPCTWMSETSKTNLFQTSSQVRQKPGSKSIRTYPYCCKIGSRKKTHFPTCADVWRLNSWLSPWFPSATVTRNQSQHIPHKRWKIPRGNSHIVSWLFYFVSVSLQSSQFSAMALCCQNKTFVNEQHFALMANWKWQQQQQ